MGLIINNQPAPVKQAPVNWSRKSALVIDDFRDFRTIVTNMLQTLGVTRLSQASNGEAAMAMIANSRYDIILCDYNLGDGKDGQQVLEEGRHRGFITAGTIFIMVTAESMSSMVLGAIEYVPDDYLVKPFSSEVLSSRLSKLIRKKEEFGAILQVLERKEYPKALELCDQGIMANPASPYEFLRIQADVLVTTGRYEKARELYAEVLAQRPILWALLGMGKIHYHLQEYEQARDVFQSVIAKNSMMMEAYDWLAKASLELGQAKEAQETLATATKLSPKVVSRQRALGEVAFRNKDLDAAARSFRTAISVGKNSCFKSPNEYLGLAKVHLENASGGDALKIVSEAKREFRDSPEALVQSAAMESVAYRALGDGKRAAAAIEEGSRRYAEASASVSAQAAMDLAKACFAVGDKEQGARLMQDVVKNNHEDARLMQDVEAVFREADMGSEGAKLIAATRDEMVRLNNEGVGLVNQGRLTDAIEYFEQAAGNLAGNKIVNANVAYALLMYMEKHGVYEDMLKKARIYLERVHEIDPRYKGYYDTLARLQKLQQVKAS
jgi:tetratricopeptide (TPR) repeat protein